MIHLQTRAGRTAHRLFPLLALSLPLTAVAAEGAGGSSTQESIMVYDDALAPGWQDWSNGIATYEVPEAAHTGTTGFVWHVNHKYTVTSDQLAADAGYVKINEIEAVCADFKAAPNAVGGFDWRPDTEPGEGIPVKAVIGVKSEEHGAYYFWATRNDWFGDFTFRVVIGEDWKTQCLTIGRKDSGADIIIDEEYLNDLNFVNFLMWGDSPTQLDCGWPETTCGDIYIDNLRWVKRAVPLPVPVPPEVPPTRVSISADLGRDGTPVSDAVYGLGFPFNAPYAFNGQPFDYSKLSFGGIRWGGNRTSRYEPYLDADNSGLDWSVWPEGMRQTAFNNCWGGDSSYNYVDLMLDLHPNAEGLITIPLTGLVAKDCTSYHESPVDDFYPDPDQTSKQVDAEFFRPWVARLRDHSLETGQPITFALDNEPSLWSSTHADLGIPELTHQELLDRALEMATMIKSEWPEVKITVLNAWGWCDIFYSDADGCYPGDDSARIGGISAMEFFARSSCENRLPGGALPFDYIDFHWYPMSSLAYSEGKASDYYYLRSTRNLWDATYQDESWIQDTLGWNAPGPQVLRRIRGWLDAECPEMGIALTEWRYGEPRGGMSGGRFNDWSHALASAEALAIFGREGVAMADLWDPMPSGGHFEQAFRLFLDYDGAGSHLKGARSIPVETGAVSGVSTIYPEYPPASSLDVSSYLLKRPEADGSIRYFLLVFNKNQTGARIDAAMQGMPAGSTWRAFSFTDRRDLEPMASGVTSVENSLTVDVPAWSATVVEVTVS